MQFIRYLCTVKLSKMFNGIESFFKKILSVSSRKWHSFIYLIESNPNVRNIGWYLIAIFYISSLLLFTHVDLVISTINVENADFKNLLFTKHAHFVSLATNIGLLLFLVIDIMITIGKHLSLFYATLINLIGVISCILITMFTLGSVRTDLKSIGAIECETGTYICMAIFFISMIVLKAKALTYTED